MMTVEQQIAYYVNLLVIQYKNLPNAQGTIRAMATECVADQIFNQVLQAFSPASAIGDQLDTIGEYVGAPRSIHGFDPTILYFSLPSYSDTPTAAIGFASYSDVTDPVDDWLSYFTSETTFILTDGQLRSLILYLIAIHASTHTIYTIDLILQEFFGDYCTFVDNEDMTITYTHLLSDPNSLFGIVNQLGLLPHPAGVQILVTEV